MSEPFSRTGHFGTYEDVLELLPAGERVAVEERARGVALTLRDVLSATSFLLRVGAYADAERLLMGRAAELEGSYYTHLKSLAGLAEEHGRPLIEMLCYRELPRARDRALGACPAGIPLVGIPPLEGTGWHRTWPGSRLVKRPF